MALAADWDLLTVRAQEFGVALTPAQTDLLRRYMELLCEWNQRFNLTAISLPEEILVKHFLDSLTCAAAVELAEQRTLIDVGTGAGFPGLVLKIAFPHLQVRLVDAVQKRLRFLERVIEELGLTGVSTLHARVEDLAAAPTQLAGRKSPGPRPPLNLREASDVVTARAVARLNVLAEWTLPLARVGGCVVAMKGPDVEEEAAEAGRAIAALGGGTPTVRTLTLPPDLGRSLVTIPKTRSTPKQYPRPPGTARKQPL